MDIASKNNLKSTYYFILVVMLPVALFYFACNDLLVNAIIETNAGKCIILVYFAGIFKAVIDTLQFHFEKSIFYTKYPEYWNAQLSWKNKYIGGNVDNGRKKIFWFIPLPALFTDAWHLFQSVYLSLLFLGIVFYEPMFNNFIFDFIFLRIVFGVTFTAFYNWYLIKR